MEQKYDKQLKELAKQLGPGFHDISVAHDDWCDLLNRKGPCNCNPEVNYGKPKTKKN